MSTEGMRAMRDLWGGLGFGQGLAGQVKKTTKAEVLGVDYLEPEANPRRRPKRDTVITGDAAADEAPQVYRPTLSGA